MIIQFWAYDPTILFNKEYISELWPTENMCYEQKLNAITRLIILLTILGYILTQSMRVLAVGALTIAVIYVLYSMRKQKVTKDMLEGFEDNKREKKREKMAGKSETDVVIAHDKYVNPVTLDSVLRSEFKEGNKKNPFSNVLLTQIGDEPERKPAPPSFNVDVDEDITRNVKRSVQMMNPGIKNTTKQLYGDMWQNFELDQSNRQFYTTPNSQVVPGDQPSFAAFLYGDMPSAKGDSAADNIQRSKDNFRYTLY